MKRFRVDLMGYVRYLTYGFLGTATFASGAQVNQYLRAGDENWDENWDGRAGAKTKATRHLYLIRHGNYLIDAELKDEKKLTELGIKQLNETGKYLQSLGLNYSDVTHSTLIRAIESCNIILNYLPKYIPKKFDDDLCEGLPYVPIPRRQSLSVAKDYDRIERAFKTYFHRADPEQKSDSHEIIVCHANVIRYFVCRALQVPPAAWLRMSLFHGSVTHVSIRPNGHVGVNTLGDIGFMPRHLLSR